MDVAYISDVAYPFVTGGAEKRIHDFGCELVARGHHVTIYTWTWWDGQSVMELNGMRMVGLGRPPPLYQNNRRSFREAKAFALRTLPALRNAQHDLIDASQFPYLHLVPVRLATFFNRTPLVVTWHEVWGGYWMKYIGLPGIAGQALEAFYARLPSHRVAVSPLVAKRLRALGAGKVEIIPNAIKIEEYCPRKRHEWDAVFVGRLIPEKGVDLLLEALALLKRRGMEVSLLIIGDGPQKGVLEKLCGKLGLKDTVEFRPFLRRHEDMLSLLGSARVFAYPSRREGFGMAVLEAMAMGVVPLLVRAPLNAATELVGDGGVVVTADAVEYAEAIKGWEEM